VETEWSAGSTADEWDMCLKFHRSGKRWIISFHYYHYQFDDGQPPEWKPLTDGSIEAKLEAIGTFPSLLKEMLAAQNALKNRLSAAQETLQALTAQLEAARKEGA